MNIRILAQDLKLSKSTVSLALRNDPRLPEHTRDRVRKRAARLGYRTDPTIAKVMGAIARKNSVDVTTPIVLLSDWPTPHHWKSTRDSLDRFYRGVIARSKELGYRVEELWMREPGLTPKRIEQILAARGTQGVIVFSYPSAPASLEVDLTPFASVVIGRALVRPRILAVDQDHHQGMFECLDQVASRGYRRPGLLLSIDAHERTLHCWAAAYLFAMSQSPIRRKIPLFLDAGRDFKRFRKWVKAYDPDVIITQDSSMLSYVTDAGFRVPDDLGLAVLFQGKPTDGTAGIDTRDEAQSARAVECLVEQLRKDIRGLPKFPETVLFDGIWRDGPTLPPKRMT